MPAAQGPVPLKGVAAYRDAACEDPDYVHAYDRYTGVSADAVLDPSVPAASSQERDVHGEDLPKTFEGRSLGQGGNEVVHGAPSTKKGPIISCVSGRGGVGKTALVAMMAAIAASWDLKVAVLDLDLSYGNLYSCFGLPGPAGLSALAKADEMGDETVLSCGSKAARNIELFGPCELPEKAEAISMLTNQILDVLSRTYDLVLVDTATASTDGLAQAMQASDRLVLVVDERPGAAAAQARMGSFAVRLGVARTRIVRLANRCGAHGKGEPNINRADVGLETARPLRVLDGGMEVVDCLAEGKVDELLELKTRFSESVATCLAKLLSELGSLPEREDAQRALEQKAERHRWTFGLRREAV